MSTKNKLISKKEITNLFPGLTHEDLTAFEVFYKITSYDNSNEKVYPLKDLETFILSMNLQKLQMLVSIKASEYAQSLKAKSIIIPDIVGDILNDMKSYYKNHPKEYKSFKSNIKQYFISEQYRTFFTEKDISAQTLLLKEEAISNFLSEDFRKKKSINVNSRLDFFCVFIGFKGWVDAVSSKFSLPTILENISYNKIAEKMNLSIEMLDSLDQKIDKLTSNQDLNHNTLLKESSTIFSELRKQSKNITSIKSFLNTTNDSSNDFSEKIQAIEQRLIETTFSITNFQNSIEYSTNRIIENQNNIADDIKTSTSKNFSSLKLFSGVIAGIIVLILSINTFIPKSDIQIKGLFDEKFDGFKSKDSTTFKLLVMPFSPDKYCAIETSEYEKQFYTRFNSIKKRDSLDMEVAFFKNTECPQDNEDIQKIIKTYGADMVIWGNYEEECDDKTKLCLNYSLSDNLSPFVSQNNFHKSSGLQEINSLASLRDGKLQSGIDDIIFWVLANYHFDKNEFAKSAKAMEKILKTKELFIPEDYLFYGDLFYKLKDYKKAFYTYKQILLHEDPLNLMLDATLPAYDSVKNNNFKGFMIDTYPSIESALLDDIYKPVMADVWDRIGKYLQFHEEYELLLPLSEKLLAYDKENLFNIGKYIKASANLGLKKNMIKAYEMVKINNESDQFTWTFLGNHLTLVKNDTLAIKAYKEAIKQKNDHLPAIKSLAKTLIRVGHKDEAFNYYNKAIQINSKDQESHYNLYSLLDKSKQTDTAINQIKKVIELNPKNYIYWYELGTLYTIKNDPSKAIETYLKALEIEPKDEDTLERLAYEYFKIGDNNKGGNIMKKIYEINPKNIESWHFLARLSIATKDYTEALKLYKDVARLHNCSAYYFKRFDNDYKNVSNFLSKEDYKNIKKLILEDCNK
ncbi:hypothetical protein T190115A13A_160035 [Tenacibaculum sp. 190524A02b]|uniref:Tetratricopeptide repeat protein n=1 Tax=Tenacibaculum vairaonense TaxID=3137860 RepID=A0ABP1F5S0_9FLAO